MTTDNPTLGRATRRAALLGGAGLAANSLGAPFVSRLWAAGPIKIGVLAPDSGERARTKAEVVAGVELLLSQQGRKARGEPVDYVLLDENDPDRARANMTRLIADHKVVAVLGGTDAGSALAMSDIAAQARVPLVVHGAMIDRLTGKGCHPWVFRMPVPFGVQFRALNPYLTGYGRKWFQISVDTVTGRAILAIAREQAQATGASETGAASIVQGDRASFAAAIEQIKAAKPDVVTGGLLGSNLTDFLTAWHAAGMTNKIPYAQICLTDTDAYAAGKQAATGVYAKTWHYADPALGTADIAFNAAFAQRHDGRPAGTLAWQAYIGMRSIISAIDATGSVEPGRIREGLLGFRYGTGEQTLQYRDSDHQMTHRVPVLETKTGITHPYDWWDVEVHYPEKATDLDRMFGTAAGNGCAMEAA